MDEEWLQRVMEAAQQHLPKGWTGGILLNCNQGTVISAKIERTIKRSGKPEAV